MAKRKDKLAEILETYSEEEIRAICAESTSRTDFAKRLGITTEQQVIFLISYISAHVGLTSNELLLINNDFDLYAIRSYMDHKNKSDLQLLIYRNYSIYQMADFFDCGKSTIEYWLKKHNLKTSHKRFSEWAKDLSSNYSLSKEQLSAHILDCLFAKDIAQIYGLSCKQVSYLIDKFELRFLYQSLYSQRIRLKYGSRKWTDKEVSKAVAENNTYNGTLRALGYTDKNTARLRELKEDIQRLGLDITHFVRVGIHPKEAPNNRIDSNDNDFAFVDKMIKNNTIGIYKIENKITGLVYIGQSIHMKERINAHRSNSYCPNSKEYYSKLGIAIRAYGIENFIVELLLECSESELDENESLYISSYDSYYNGYNSTTGGANNFPTRIARRRERETKIEEIANDLKNTTLTQREIASKWGESINFVSEINNGLFQERHEYECPIRPRTKKTLKGNLTETQLNNNDNHKVKQHKNKRVVKTHCLSDEISRHELQKLIFTKSFREIAKIFNVSDNTIKNLCRFYGLPSNRTLIQLMSQQEWDDVCSVQHDDEFYANLLLSKEQNIIFLYSEEHKSMYFIAHKFNISKGTVKTILLKHNIVLHEVDLNDRIIYVEEYHCCFKTIKSLANFLIKQNIAKGNLKDVHTIICRKLKEHKPYHGLHMFRLSELNKDHKAWKKKPLDII